MPLAQEIALDCLETADHLIHETANLRQIPCDRLCFVADSVADARRQRLFERRRGDGERFDLFPRPREQRVECGRVGALLDPFLRALDRPVFHVRQGYRWLRMKTRELEYDLPVELIAQHPLARRDESRLLIYDRMSERV